MIAGSHAKKQGRITVAVLCGGPSSEREVSLASGMNVARGLSRNRYTVRLIRLPKDTARILRALPRLLRGIDVAFVALHGQFGEDGTIQAALEMMGIPYTGSGVLASALSMHKLQAGRIAAAHGISVPKTVAIPETTDNRTAAAHVIKKIGLPCVIKPEASGSSVGVSIVQRRSELLPAIRAARREGVVIAQAYIRGKEVTCGVLGNSGGLLTALPPIEIVSAGTFFDYHAKYHSAATKEICPAPLPARTLRKIERAAVAAHAALGCDGLTRSDFMLTQNGTLYFLETNTIPGMTKASLCPKEAKALGWSLDDFLDRIVRLALAR